MKELFSMGNGIFFSAIVLEGKTRNKGFEGMAFIRETNALNWKQKKCTKKVIGEWRKLSSEIAAMFFIVFFVTCLQW